MFTYPCFTLIKKMWVHVPVLHVVFWWLWFYITIISWYPWQFMNLIGFNDSEIHTHTKKSWKNGHKLKMSLSMVNKEKDIHLFDIFIEKHSIAPDKTMAWQNSLRINETQEEWVVCPWCSMSITLYLIHNL